MLSFFFEFKASLGHSIARSRLYVYNSLRSTSRSCKLQIQIRVRTILAYPNCSGLSSPSQDVRINIEIGTKYLPRCYVSFSSSSFRFRTPVFDAATPACKDVGGRRTTQFIWESESVIRSRLRSSSRRSGSVSAVDTEALGALLRNSILSMGADSYRDRWR